MTISFDSLITPLTQEEVEASIYQVLAANNLNSSIWRTRAMRTTITGVAILLSAFSSANALIARSGFLDLSAGDWLTLVAFYVYGVEREEATFATGEVTLVNAAGGVFSFDPEDVIVSAAGKTYRNTGAFNLDAFATATIAIRATEAGAASTAAAGEIDTLETTLTGVTCSNAAAVVGRDTETDETLRARCREKPGSLSPFGPWDAYGYVVRNAKRADGSSVGVTRVRINKDGFGNVYVWVATASGPVDADEDLDRIRLAVQQSAAPFTDTAHVESATVRPIAVAYEAWMYERADLSAAQVQAMIEARLVSFMSAQPLGGNVIEPAPGRVFTSAIATAIGTTLPEIFRVAVTAPVEYVTLAVSEVPVLDGSPVAIVHVVPRPNEELEEA